MLGPLSTTGMSPPNRKRLGGPEYSTNNAIPKFDGSNAQFLKNTEVTISDEDKLHYFSSYTDINDFVSVSGTASANLNISDHHRITLTEDTDIIFSNVSIGQEFWVLIYFDGFDFTFPSTVTFDQSYIYDPTRTWTLFRFVCTGSNIYSLPLFIGWIEASYPIRPIKTVADAATITFDFDISRKQSVILGGARTLVFANFFNGLIFAINIVQDSTGSRLVTWPSNIKWPDGVEPTLSTTANASDWFCFICTNDDGHFECLGQVLNLS